VSRNDARARCGPRRKIPDVSADALRQAYEALASGDPDPLVALMSDDMTWNARKRPLRFWKPPRY